MPAVMPVQRRALARIRLVGGRAMGGLAERCPDAVGRGPVAAIAAVLVLLLAGSAATGGYTVRRGDTLSEIAQRAGTTVRQLAATNGIADPDRIKVGQTLVLPGAGSASAATSGTHVVKRGETLGQIARRHGMSVEALAAANGITDVGLVMAGSRLRLGGPAAAHPAAGGAGIHVVRPGETLGGIALRYGTTAGSLAAANGIPNPNKVVAGTRLRVSGGGAAGPVCPVPGARFVNDFGVPKPDGRFHEGIDLFAPAGTPVRATVGGRVEQLEGSRGGLQYWLYGDDGALYIGTHLSAFGTGGRVAPGAVIGYVGASGNARGTSPHLHYEVHPGGAGSTAVNPYPTLRAGC